MFAQLMTWGEKILLAMAQFYSFLEQNLLEIFEGLGWQWLSDALDWLIDALGHLPEFLTLFGDELLSFTFETPLFDLIVLSIPAYLAYQLIIWVLNIIT